MRCSRRCGGSRPSRGRRRSSCPGVAGEDVTGVEPAVPPRLDGLVGHAEVAEVEGPGPSLRIMSSPGWSRPAPPRSSGSTSLSSYPGKPSRASAAAPVTDLPGGVGDDRAARLGDVEDRQDAGAEAAIELLGTRASSAHADVPQRRGGLSSGGAGASRGSGPSSRPGSRLCTGLRDLLPEIAGAEDIPDDDSPADHGEEERHRLAPTWLGELGP